jgi:hypothetical protein
VIDWQPIVVKDLFGDDSTPEFYVDSVRFGVGAYGIVFDLGVQGIQDTPMSELPPVRRVAIVRMSPQHALIFSKLLQKNLRAYQEKVGRIELPRQIYDELGIEPE